MTQLTYDIAEFIVNNKNDIAKDIKSDVIKFIDRQNLFNDGIFKLAFEESKKEFITISIKLVIMSNFHLTIEIVNDIIDEDFIRLLTQYFFYDDKTYKGE